MNICILCYNNGWWGIYIRCVLVLTLEKYTDLNRIRKDGKSEQWHVQILHNYVIRMTEIYTFDERILHILWYIWTRMFV